MDKKEMVVNTLKTYGCSTSKQIANLISRDYNVVLTPSQVAGTIRPLITSGQAANSKNDKNVTVYWLVERNW